EIVSIIGPSGSGKTTLLNIIGGLSRATAGTVIVGNVKVTALTESQLVEYRRKIVGHVFQTLNLIPTLTAAENIELPMMALKIPKNKRVKRVKELLKIVGLTHRAKHKPGELSGGERQRVALAAALANDPPVILADEPTGELDTVNSKIVVNYLLKINREMGKTILMVTHDPVVARAAKRILRIEDGVIKSTLQPTQLYGEEKSITFADQIRIRINDLNMQLQSLDEKLKLGKISGEEYFEERQKITQIIRVYKEELCRLGIVT
ncbi:TPA: ABC transporter ATP-binding protein, partial [Candidatus Bathyarchaeota archaeon]|nr:ABC transporter ATP-binding protein [Candidatus Bathyarchaeota archaeon]